jgi:pimeloyl-ACP methyl ester carboxylesterase
LRADAVGVDRFALQGQLQGCVISIAYALRHPERVTKLVLIGGFPRAATGAR